MNFKKRQLILASLVVALGGAVYLNWQFKDAGGIVAPSNIETSTKELGQAMFVNSTNKGQAAEKNAQPNPKQEESTSMYFKAAEEKRKKAREEATDMIKEILNDPKSSDNVKAEAIKQSSTISKVIQQESGLENLIKAKGFKDCLVFIQNDECSVVVGGKTLDENLVLGIKDIVNGQGGIALENIKVQEAE